MTRATVIRCDRCNHGDRRPQRRARLAEKEGRTALVLAVPVEVCPACGQVWLSLSTAKHLDAIFLRLLSIGAEVATIHWDPELVGRSSATAADRKE